MNGIHGKIWLKILSGNISLKFKVDQKIQDLLKVNRMTHEYFEEYAIQWSLEASKIRIFVPEEELVQFLSGF